MKPTCRSFGNETTARRNARTRGFAVAIAFWTLADMAHAQQPVPASHEFKVNSYPSTGRYPATSGDGQGNFVVVWQTDHADGRDDEVFGRLYDASGRPLGDEFRVNSYTTHRQEFPAVAMNASGDFVVTWRSWMAYSQTVVEPGIFARRFDSSGNPLGQEVQVSGAPRVPQSSPAVDIDAAGNFVVVWEGYVQGRSYFGVMARAFDAAGNPRGPDRPLAVEPSSPGLAGTARQPAVALHPTSGEFVVAWTRCCQGDGSRIEAGRFDADGDLLDDTFVVKASTTQNGRFPAVARDAEGNFAVVWLSGRDVRGRLYDEFGGALAGDFLVSAYGTGLTGPPALSMEPTGDFVVVWDTEGQDGSDLGVFGRSFAADATPRGDEFAINAYTNGRQQLPAIAPGTPGSFLVAWSGPDHALGNASGESILARRFGPDLIFADGFESGDLSAWSSAQTDGTDLTVSAAAAMAGTSYGLHAVVNDRAGLYVEDDSPAGEARFRARFYLDPSAFDPGEAAGRFRTRVFLAFADAPLKRLVQVVLRRQSGQYSLAARVRLDDDTLAETPFSDVSAGPHVVELDWRQSSAPGADDGALELWIDGLSAGNVAGLDNDARAVDFVRLGALSVKEGASGTLRFDEFESRRASAIGP
jgi:hypothetical protein